MDSTLRTTIEQVRSHLSDHPDDGPQTDAVVHVRRRGPLRFEAVDPAGRQVVADMPEAIGGGGLGMAPGSIMRSALGCCNATTIALEAEARGVELTTLEVTVASSSDLRGLLAVDGVTAGPLGMNVSYRLVSPSATDADLRSLVEYAEHHSPMLQALRRAIPVQTDLVVDQP